MATVLNVNQFKYPVEIRKCKSVINATKPIILLLAAGQQLNDFGWLKSYLSQYSDVITIAHTATPNTLNSAETYKKYMKDFKMDIECIRNTLNHFHINQANIIGVSFGGVLAYLFAKKYPFMVHFMMLSSVGLYLSNQCKNAIVYYNGMENKNDYKTASKLLAETFTAQRLKQSVLTKYFFSMFTSDPVVHCQLTHHVQRVLRYFDVDKFNANHHINVIDIPSLVLCAKKDILFPFHSSLYLAGSIKNVAFVTVDGDHLWQSESKDTRHMFCQHATDLFMRSRFFDSNFEFLY
eukprot:803175_1